MLVFIPEFEKIVVFFKDQKISQMLHCLTFKLVSQILVLENKKTIWMRL